MRLAGGGAGAVMLRKVSCLAPRIGPAGSGNGTAGAQQVARLAAAAAAAVAVAVALVDSDDLTREYLVPSVYRFRRLPYFPASWKRDFGPTAQPAAAPPRWRQTAAKGRETRCWIDLDLVGRRAVIVDLAGLVGAVLLPLGPGEYGGLGLAAGVAGIRLQRGARHHQKKENRQRAKGTAS